MEHLKRTYGLKAVVAVRSQGCRGMCFDVGPQMTHLWMVCFHDVIQECGKHAPALRPRRNVHIPYPQVVGRNAESITAFIEKPLSLRHNPGGRNRDTAHRRRVEAQTVPEA